MRRRLLLSAAFVLLSVIPVLSQTKVKVQCVASQGGNVVVTSGTSSTTKVLKTFPNSTVTVYSTGTLSTISLWTSSTGSVTKSNPFTASSTTADCSFYATPGQRVDITFSGTGIATPFTVSDVRVENPIAGAVATTTTLGSVLMSVAPVAAASPIAVGDNDSRMPTQGENNALVGSFGTPGSANRYVTETDPVLLGGGAAGGDLGGTYPNPTVTQARGLRETGGPTTLTLGAVTDGQFLKRDGSTIVGVTSGISGEVWLNAVTDCGMVGDDATDNSAALNACIITAAASPAGKKKIAFPGGVYLFVTKISWNPAISLEGAAMSALLTGLAFNEDPNQMGTTFKTASAITLFEADALASFWAGSGTVSNITFEGSGVGVVGIHIRSVQRSLFDRIKVRGFTTGVDLDGPLWTRFTSSEFLRNGVGVETSTALTGSNMLHFDKCIWSKNTTWGLLSNSTNGLYLNEVNFEFNGTSGDDTTGAFKVGNDFGGGAYAGFTLTKGWFENNLGWADISIGKPDGASIINRNVIMDTDFHVTSHAGLKHTIWVDGSGAASHLMIQRSQIRGDASIGNLVVSANNQMRIHFDNYSYNTTARGTLSIPNGVQVFVDGFRTVSASLDFGQLGANACSEMSITTVYGISDGDPVIIGVPAALRNHNSTSRLDGFVDGANTVTVRRCVVTADGSNPAAATVTVSVKHQT